MGDKSALPVLVGPFCGPVHGVSVINNALYAIMAQRGPAPAIIDLSPGLRARGPAYHAARMGRTVWGVLRILGAAFSGRRRHYVMHLDGGGGLVYNIALALALRLTSQRMLFYHHSSHYVLADSALMRLLLAVAGSPPQSFCSGKMAGLFCARYGARGQTLVINNAAWVADVEGGRRNNDGRLRLGFLSALSLEKGVGRAIETLRLLRGRGIAAELALAGPAGDPAARALIEKARSEFGSALIVRGVVQGPDKDAFLAGLDYFLFPSLYPHETQSLVVPEALSAGIPVIALDHRFVGEVVGQGGLLVPPDADYAARAVDWILAGQGEIEERRRRARRQFEAERAQAAGQVDRLLAWSMGQT
jgi:glycosyltransferase involved in cell wall biosynthesis